MEKVLRLMAARRLGDEEARYCRRLSGTSVHRRGYRRGTGESGLDQQDAANRRAKDVPLL
jgi:hypothetical protein